MRVRKDQEQAAKAVLQPRVVLRIRSVAVVTCLGVLALKALLPLLPLMLSSRIWSATSALVVQHVGLLLPSQCAA